MSSTQPTTDTATEASGVAAVPMRFEVAVLPVADVDRAWELQEITERLPGRE